MGLLDLLKRIEKGSYTDPTKKLTGAEVDSNLQKLIDLYPTPTNADIGKTVVLRTDKKGFEYVALPSNTSGNTLQFPADPSLDISLHKNRLVMNDGGVAKLANLSGGTVGQKGKFRITTDSLPQYPVGAIYEFDFMGVNFNDGDEITIAIAEEHNVVNQFTLGVARNSPSSSYEFQIGVDLAASLVAWVGVLSNIQIGAWEVSVNGSKVVFRNNHILTGINGSTSYALPTEYNFREAMFVRRDISTFNPAVGYTVDGGFTQASFGDQYGGNINLPLDPINVDNVYPIPFGVGGYFIDTNGNLVYYNGSTYELVTSRFRDEQGNLYFASPAFSGNPNGANLIGGVFNTYVPTFSTNLGTNYTITQTRQGVDGIVQAWVDANLNQKDQGLMIYLNDGNCNQRTVLHAFSLMGDFSGIGIPVGDYSNWSIPTSNLEFSKILKSAISQNQNMFFSVTADGHNNNEAWIEIEEVDLQTYGNCNPQLISWYDNYGLNPFSTWFVRTQLQAPMLGTLPILNKPVLGFLQDIVNGEALISDATVNTGVVEDIAGNEITQGQIDAIETDLENVLQCYYALGTDGQLKKLTLLGNIQDDVVAPYIILGGGIFVACHAAGRGETALFRRITSFGH